MTPIRECLSALSRGQSVSDVLFAASCGPVAPISFSVSVFWGGKKVNFEATIHIPHAYPLQRTQFSLKLSTQSSQHQDILPSSSASSSAVDTTALRLSEETFFDNNNARALESELNDYCEELLTEGVDPNSLLTLQIRKLLV